MIRHKIGTKLAQTLTHDFVLKIGDIDTYISVVYGVTTDTADTSAQIKMGGYMPFDTLCSGSSTVDDNTEIRYCGQAYGNSMIPCLPL